MSHPDALLEWRYWETLSGEEREVNAYGFPPYNVVDVAWQVLGMLGPHRRSRVLDLGCGPGRLADAVQARWPVTVLACDISQAMLDRVPPHNIEKFLLDGRNIPDAVGKVDYAYSVAMFQHIPHEAQASYIGQVADRLYVGGRFAFTMAMGNTNRFLNHQVTVEQVVGWLAPLVPLHHFADGRGWSWFVAVKP